MQPATDTHSVHRRDDRLPHLVLPGRQAQLGTARPPGLLSKGVGISTELDHIEARLEDPALARVHDHPDGGILVQLTPGRLQLVEHERIHGVAGLGAVEDEPSDRALALDQQCGELFQLRGTSRHGRDAYGSGSRGKPRTRSPRMFLLISVVPPSIVLARLRSIPRTS